MDLADNHFMILISVGAFFCNLLIILSIINLYKKRKSRQVIVAKIKAYQANDITGGMSDDFHVDHSNKRPAVTRLFELLGGFFQRKKKTAEGYSSRLRFLRAGLRWQKPSSIFFGLKFFFGSAASLAFLVLGLTVIPLENHQVIIVSAVLTALAGFFLPELWLHYRTRKRQEAILKGFPDALDLLVVCVEAGMGLDGAFSRVANEIRFAHPDISEELHILNLELRAGKSRPEALKNLSLRAGLPVIEAFVSLMVQADRFGTSVGTALKTYSESYRTERLQKAEEKAAKLSVKMVFPLIFFIFPALFSVLMGPSVIRIYNALIQK